MLHDPARHEALQPIAWDEDRVRAAIEHIARDAEAQCAADGTWHLHPLDRGPEDPDLPAIGLYDGACGVMWALHHLQATGAVTLQRTWLAEAAELEHLLERNHACLKAFDDDGEVASWLMGDTPLLMLAHGHQPSADLAARLAALIESNIDHPARELMWGAPGTLLAALFLHQHSGDERWAVLYRATAARLWSQLVWSPEHACHHWVQDLFDRRSTYLDAVHGFVATASPLIRGRHLLDADAWAAWRACIANTVERTATWEGGLANWRDQLDMPAGYTWKKLMQFCHGAPGFVVCLADFPGPELDRLMLAAGEATWTAGPLAKGSDLCHGTGGNGYAFLKLHTRTSDPLWLARARAFAMHAIAQTEAEAQRHRQMRHSLWTGDIGLAIYLWDCVREAAEFPTLDVFFGGAMNA